MQRIGRVASVVVAIGSAVACRGHDDAAARRTTSGPLAAQPRSVTFANGVSDARTIAVDAPAEVTEADDCGAGRMPVAAVTAAHGRDARLELTVRPNAPGSCTIVLGDPAGARIAVPIVVL